MERSEVEAEGAGRRAISSRLGGCAADGAEDVAGLSTVALALGLGGGATEIPLASRISSAL